MSVSKMRIYGFDFTSAPSRQKAITCTIAEIVQNRLKIDAHLELVSLADFEAFLSRPGPWVAGFDFPFGQPEKLIRNLGWPQSWAGYVEHISKMSLKDFEDTLTRYRQPRPTGDKHHKRATDHHAKSISPMTLHGVPVGKMFFRGAPILLRSNISVRPCRPTTDNRLALEAYPALVARKWLGKRRYKSDDRRKQSTDQEAARCDLINKLKSPDLNVWYGLTLEISASLPRQYIQDPTGDSLDALLCAIQAAWAYAQPNAGFGIPNSCSPCEGWIVDPELLQVP